MSIKNGHVGLFVALFALVLTGCSKELGRVPFATEATGDTSVQLASGNVDFWTDLSLVYRGHPSLQYQIDLEQGGRTVARAECDPLGPLPTQLWWQEVTRGAYRHVSGIGRMPCSAYLSKGGPTTVRVTLAHDVTAKDVALTKADLIVKQ